MEDFKRFTSLFCAFTKGKGVHIINKTNSRSRKVVGVADFNKVSIVEKEKNRRQRRPLWDAILCRKLRRRKARKTERRRALRNEGGNVGDNPFRNVSFSQVVEKSGRYDSVKRPSHVKRQQ
jgi:hypothetical protein